MYEDGWNLRRIQTLSVAYHVICLIIDLQFPNTLSSAAQASCLIRKRLGVGPQHYAKWAVLLPRAAIYLHFDSNKMHPKGWQECARIREESVQPATYKSPTAGADSAMLFLLLWWPATETATKQFIEKWTLSAAP